MRTYADCAFFGGPDHGNRRAMPLCTNGWPPLELWVAHHGPAGLGRRLAYRLTVDTKGESGPAFVYVYMPAGEDDAVLPAGALDRALAPPPRH